MIDLSILIPARNEMFLSRTVEDIIQHAESNYEIIAILDGEWANPPIEQHPRVTVLRFPESRGQRAATNAAARIARGEYLAKCDAHCAFDQGFDAKLLQDIQPDLTMVPIMRNLHAFNWVCPNRHTRYQGPSGPCTECGEPTTMDIIWFPKPSPRSAAYCFDNEPKFQYFGEFSKRPEGKGDITESMSLQGSFFMISRARYFDLNISDEAFGSWGSQGIEVAAKSWLSGGRVVVNHRTWYAHMFRTQGGDFGFPYHLSGHQTEHAKKTARHLFFENKWEKQIKPLSWLVEKFWPVPGWTADDLAEIKKFDNFTPAQPGQTSTPAQPVQAKDENVKPVINKQLTWGVIYYTDNRLDQEIMQKCQKQLLKGVGWHKLVSVSLQPIDFGRNITMPLERGWLTMFKQILAGLQVIDTDYVFFAEHDVLYHPSHFQFIPQRQDIFYYNTNVWKLRWSDGHGLHYDCQQLSGLCAFRELLIDHYTKRIQLVEQAGGFSMAMGFEPGTHGRDERVDDYKAESWQSQWPNIDIRHDTNATPSRWEKDEFRNQRFTAGWTENDNIPGWGHKWHFWKKI